MAAQTILPMLQASSYCTHLTAIASNVHVGYNYYKMTAPHLSLSLQLKTYIFILDLMFFLQNHLQCSIFTKGTQSREMFSPRWCSQRWFGTAPKFPLLNPNSSLASSHGKDQLRTVCSDESISFTIYLPSSGEYTRKTLIITIIFQAPHYLLLHLNWLSSIIFPAHSFSSRSVAFSCSSFRFSSFEFIVLLFNFFYHSSANKYFSIERLLLVLAGKLYDTRSAFQKLAFFFTLKLVIFKPENCLIRWCTAQFPVLS